MSWYVQCVCISGRGDLVTQDIGEAEILNNPFTSLSSKSSSQTAWEGKGRDWENEEQSTVGEEQVQERLRNLKTHKSMGPDEMQLWVLRELMD